MTDTIEPWIFNITAMTGFVLVLMTILFAIRGMARGEHIQAVMTLVVGSAIGGMCLFMKDFTNVLNESVDRLVGPLDGGDSKPTPKPSPSSSHTPDPTPATQDPELPSDPVHVPWELLGAIAAMVLVAAIAGLIIWYFGTKARRRLKEQADANAARKERQSILDKTWAQAVALHKTLDDQWHSYEDSLEAILETPLMRNLEDPAVASAVRAMSKAASLRSDHAPRLTLHQSVEDASGYVFAVNDYQTALKAAQQKANIRGIDDFADDEQDAIKRARNMLNKALDDGASENERQMAYDQVIKIVKKLRKLSVPKTALTKIELTSGVTSRLAIEASASVFDD